MNWGVADCGVSVTTVDGSRSMRLHTTGPDKALWVTGWPSRRQWLRGAAAAGMDKRQARRFRRRHAAHHRT